MRIGCLGFGQVGATFAATLANHDAEVSCFDPRIKDLNSLSPTITFGSFNEIFAGTD